jgi:dipeptidyl aminopeptidase/acylaminoacyl peptidase
MRALASALFLALCLPVFADAELLERYRRADNLGRLVDGKTQNVNLRATWVNDEILVYRAERPNKTAEYLLVNAKTGNRQRAFDHEKLAEFLGKELQRKIDPNTLSLTDFTLESDLRNIRFRQGDVIYRGDRETLALTKLAPPRPANGRGQANQSPDGKLRFRVREGKLELRQADQEGDTWIGASNLDEFSTARWSPDSKTLVAFRLIPGDRKLVYRLRSSVPNTTRAVLESNRYDQPGDKMDTAEIHLLNLENWAGKEAPPTKKVDAPPFFCTQYPYFGVPSTEWWKNGERLLLQNPVRGYQAYEIWSIDPKSGAAKVVLREESDTFVDLGRVMFEPLPSMNAFLWQSQSSGWAQFYRVDAETGARTPITNGQYVVRSVEQLDEANKTLTFSANGREPGDPYHRHYYRINLDGSNLVHLTPGNGTHDVTWSPNRAHFVDSYSSLNVAPIHELRRADGSLVTLLEKAQVNELTKLNVRPLEPFMAKGRDGKTDIWGCIVFPTDFDAKKKYPVIENIYAGPHDSHVPKRFFVQTGMHRLAELGFIVVQIDGMGTNNRGKAFHDVAWKNLKDAGFPDRIAWMKAAAKKYPAMDLTRVGVYGTSAGGQNAAGAVLFHPDFYKVAVASCGCHDNRIDKQWWNEQWMGAMGPHFAENSNIDHAAKLKGHLLLMVGEVDTNVPPESTYRFADALIKAGKDFDFVLLPGLDHTGGGEYGERKRRDFFVRWLLGKEPPRWNEL